MSEYTADDREPGEFPTDPTFEVRDQSRPWRAAAVMGGMPSPDALRTLWKERDAQYATSPKYLTDKQIEDVRAFRLIEAKAAYEAGTDVALIIEVQNWYPPEHGQ